MLDGWWDWEGMLGRVMFSGVVTFDPADWVRAVFARMIFRKCRKVGYRKHQGVYPVKPWGPLCLRGYILKVITQHYQIGFQSAQSNRTHLLKIIRAKTARVQICGINPFDTCNHPSTNHPSS